jgi:tetratricopeptide (TPR) repeat protein
MKGAPFFLALVLFCYPVAAQQSSPASPQAKTVSLMPGLGDLHHPVFTKNPEAQKFFDQGLRLIYAFNHDEAARSFQHAAELDPTMAMAYWGIAEAVGPNYNDPANEPRRKQAYDAIQKALQLSADAPVNERAYIEALAQRYADDPNADLRQLAVNYANAMREVMKKYPDDLDAATLFAEAEMNLHPWGLWKADGTPEEGTEEVISVLESVIRRDPNHMGAVHYYIHAVEASPNPERALASANRLAALAPAAGHLVHMPAHIYIRTGYYDAAVKTNEQAAAADRAYIEASGVQGLYPMMYYSHNLHFIAISAGMTGQFSEAKRAAAQLVDNVRPHVKDMPPLEAFMIIPPAVLVRFHHWSDILRLPAPDPSMKIATSFWHFARGMAFAGTGKLSEAQAEHTELVAIENATPADAIYSMPFNNKTRDILKIADNVLAAKIAMARCDPASAIPLLHEAVAVQDSLNYGEPPDWFFPVRESLGAALLINGNAVEAEKVFREDLQRNPRNPRSLFGLRESLKAQKRDYDAHFVDTQFRAAWKAADTQLSLQELGT